MKQIIKSVLLVFLVIFLFQDKKASVYGILAKAIDGMKFRYQCSYPNYPYYEENLSIVNLIAAFMRLHLIHKTGDDQSEI